MLHSALLLVGVECGSVVNTATYCVRTMSSFPILIPHERVLTLINMFLFYAAYTEDSGFPEHLSFELSTDRDGLHQKYHFVKLIFVFLLSRTGIHSQTAVPHLSFSCLVPICNKAYT